MATQLSLPERIIIERMIHQDYSFASIARNLNRSASTIAREVLHYRCFTSRLPISGENDCIYKSSCLRNTLCPEVGIHGCYGARCKRCPEGLICTDICNRYESSQCDLLDKPPYVCSCCRMQKGCKKIKAYYSAHKANAAHHKAIKDAHSGIRKTPAELREIAEIIEPLIAKGQSLNHICTTHSEELGVSERTLYNYIDQGLLLARNVDLKRKVKFKPRKCHKTQITDREVFNGRTFQDFMDTHAYETGYWQMDTVKSARGSLKCILTLYHPEYELLIARLMNRCTPGAVKLEFLALQRLIGDDVEFSCLFENILTDRGVEFGRPNELEQITPEFSRTNIFYCDPMRSCQKAGIENVHTMLRMILPKGTIFEDLTQWDIRKCADHINCAPRKKLNRDTPYNLALKYLGESIMKKLQLRFIAPDEVTLSPKLLHH